MQDYKISQDINEDEHNINLTSENSLVFCNNDGTVRTYYGTKKIFYRFLEKYGLDKYNIHFHTLRHTFSNMLFEADQNPKVIQALLGHKSVKTTITTYNSVDKSYFQKATDVINKNFKVEESKTNPKDMEDNELDEELEKLLKEKQARRKRNKDFEM